jgi:hypothetical protein
MPALNSTAAEHRPAETARAPDSSPEIETFLILSIEFIGI